MLAVGGQRIRVELIAIAGCAPDVGEAPRRATEGPARAPRPCSLELSNALASMRLFPWRPLPLLMFASKHHPAAAEPQPPARPIPRRIAFCPYPASASAAAKTAGEIARRTSDRTTPVNAIRNQCVRPLWLNSGTMVDISLRHGNTRLTTAARMSSGSRRKPTVSSRRKGHLLGTVACSERSPAMRAPSTLLLRDGLKPLSPGTSRPGTLRGETLSREARSEFQPSTQPRAPVRVPRTQSRHTSRATLARYLAK